MIYICSVIQDLSIGTAVRQFEAIDIDSDDTAFSYDIRVSDSRAAALTIDRGTGMISTYTSLTNLGQRRFTAKVTGQCLLLIIAIITKSMVSILMVSILIVTVVMVSILMVSVLMVSILMVSILLVCHNNSSKTTSSCSLANRNYWEF